MLIPVTAESCIQQKLRYTLIIYCEMSSSRAQVVNYSIMHERISSVFSTSCHAPEKLLPLMHFNLLHVFIRILPSFKPGACDSYFPFAHSFLTFQGFSCK